MFDWYNEPARWSPDGGALTVVTAPKSDFWRKTHYGFVRDSGHFFHREVTGDFTVEVEVEGAYRDQYDQAGLMVRLDESCWMKCGIELVDGTQNASVVVTRDYSDWSFVPLPEPPASLRLRVDRRGGTVEVWYALPGGEYQLLRTAWLSDAPTLKAGPMCASPDGEGLECTFRDLKIEEKV